MEKRTFILISVICLLMIFSSIVQADIVGVFPVDWGMDIDEVFDKIESSQDFEYVGEDFT